MSITDFAASQRSKPALFLHFLKFLNFEGTKATTLSYVIPENPNLHSTSASYLINTVEQLSRSKSVDFDFDDENDEELMDGSTWN